MPGKNVSVKVGQNGEVMDKNVININLVNRQWEITKWVVALE